MCARLLLFVTLLCATALAQSGGDAEDSFLLQYIPNVPKWILDLEFRVSNLLPEGTSVWRVIVCVIISEFAVLFNLLTPTPKWFSGIKKFCQLLAIPIAIITIGIPLFFLFFSFSDHLFDKIVGLTCIILRKCIFLDKEVA